VTPGAPAARPGRPDSAAPAPVAPGLPAVRPPRRREVVTPEGVPLSFELALAGDRLGAFLLDLVLIVAVLVAVGVPLGWLATQQALPGDLILSLALLSLFLVRTFYFAFFELSWQGQTPGKRALRLRAIDARGGPLSAEAIIARNLTREVELFLPLIALVAPGVLYPEAPAWARLPALGWMLLFGLLPLFNRDRLRVGDLVGGTVVVRLPATLLLPDLTEAPAAGLAFSDDQLDVYGTYELQVLEGVLRDRALPGSGQSLSLVAGTIRRKLGWEGEPVEDAAFLEAFYAALRDRLERRLLFGRRRADKHDRGG
jgi:uncharacterized RDD family membrane protein YckC